LEAVILSHFDMIIGPKIFLSAPEPLDFDNLNQIPALMDLYSTEFFIHITDEFKSINLIFDIPSEHARGNLELLQISIVFDVETGLKFESLREILVDFSKRVNNISQCYKAFYLDSPKESDEKIYEELKGIFFSFFKSIKPLIRELQKAEKKLRESEKRYRELVENVNSIILKWDFHGNILFINSYGERFFGYKREDLVGKNVIGTIVPMSDTSGKNLKIFIDEIRARPDEYEKNINENITKSGKKVIVSWSNRGLRDDDGKVIGILSVGNDITNLEEMRKD